MVEYELTLADGETLRFTVPATGTAAPTGDDLPGWTALAFHQCPNCPLAAETHPRCPPAADLAEIAERFRGLLSYERMRVRVRQDGREIGLECDVQTGLSSLVGLVMASSACPILAQLRPLARFHLPFANLEETLFRTVGTYLLKQYFVARDGGDPDFQLAGLAALYDDLKRVNQAFKQRVEAASERDANVNAIANLFSLAALVSFSLDRGLDQLRPLVASAGEDPERRDGP